MSDDYVLYIHPPKLPNWVYHDWKELWGGFFHMPMGVIALANVLIDAGIRVKGLNYAMEMDLDQLFDLEGWLKKQEEPLLIMLDLHWFEHSFGALEIARLCKLIFPHVPVLLGGFTASIYAEEILENFTQIDYIIRGDAELPLLKLVEHIKGEEQYTLAEIPNLSFRADGRVRGNPRTYIATSDDLDKLNFADITFLENYPAYYWRESSRYRSLTGLWLCIGRGCMSDCIWCGGGRTAQRITAGRDGLVKRSAAKAAQDIVHLSSLGLDQVALSHDISLLGREYWQTVFDEMKRHKARIGIFNQQFQLPSEEFLYALAEAADTATCQLELSPISGSEHVRRFNGKLFSNEQFYETLTLVRQLEIPVFVYFSMNLPLEDEETFPETLDMARRIHDFYPPHLLRMSNMLHTIDPCCTMYREPRIHGIQRLWNGFMDYYEYCQLSTVTRSDEEVAKLRGFDTIDPAARSLSVMMEKWADFCHEVGEENCFHFP